VVLTGTATPVPSNSQVFTLTFATPYAVAPVVVISGMNAGAFAAGIYVSGVSTTAFTVTQVNASAANVPVSVAYMVVQ